MGVKKVRKRKPGAEGAAAATVRATERATGDAAAAEERRPPAAASKADEGATTGKSTTEPKRAATIPPRRPKTATPGPAHRSLADEAAALRAAATRKKEIGVYFEDEAYVTYEGSRIPWYVRLMWIGFWAIVFFYIVNFLWPDAQRYLVK